MSQPADARAPSKRGGARPGAGRPCKVLDVAADADPLEYLQLLMTSKSTPEPLRLKAAIALASFKHAKPAAQPAPGKKEKAKEQAEQLASNGRFKPGRAPLAVVGAAGKP